MRHVRLPWSAARRIALLAGAALAFSPLGAQAQEGQALSSPADAAGLRGYQGAPAPPPPDRAEVKPVEAAIGEDGLAPSDVYLEADVLIEDNEAKTITARGHVEARHQGRTIRADEVVYDRDTGAARAKGNVMLLGPEGVEYSSEVVLDDELRSGVATAFAARLDMNVTIIAGAAIRRNENVNELKSAVYTPCNICREDGSPKEPTWSVQATKVVQDREHQVIYYRNAIVRVHGVPVLYSPIFWHPDPSAKRRSGLLAPRIRYANRLGVSYEQPYLWVISPSSDLVVSPMITTEVNPLLNLEYRKRFYSGVLQARLGYTYEKRFDGAGRYGDATSRSYILADGVFQISDQWRWGFGAERVSDPTLFARYRIDNIYRRRGPFTTDTQRLISQIYAERQDRSSYFSISALSFQSLRVLQNGREIVSYDPTNAFPLVAPLIEARFNPEEPVLGGRLRMVGSAVMLSRNQDTSKLTTLGIQQNQAIDTRRASAQVDWRRAITTPAGLRVEPFLIARTDVYSINNPLASDPTNAFARGVATLGADLSYPFIRQQGASSIILEPLAQLALSPDSKRNPNVPNEDSVALEFDSTNLFSPNRFPGYDLYEGGRRANLGGRASFNWGAGRSATVLVGRSFREQANGSFYVGSGLEGRTSDWVTAVTIQPIQGLSFFSRSRLDGNSLRIRREEAGIDLNIWRINASTRYLFSERDASGVRTESISLGGSLKVSEHWGASIATVRDLNEGLWPFTQYSIYYQDECLRVDVLFTHDQTFARTIVPSNSIQLRLTLATLGGQGR